MHPSPLLPSLAAVAVPASPSRIAFAEPAHFSTLELLLLAVVTAASIALFTHRLLPIARRIVNSRRTDELNLAHLGQRTRTFVWEVLCQGKVIRQRPLPGLAHAFVFWGFLAFALVSLNHLALAVHLGFLDASRPLSTVYILFAAAWALLVAVSIAGLFIRRFLVRPRWLGEKVSIESGVIAVLIFVLMVTYLGAFVLPAAGLGLRALWWTHTLALLVFLPLIPHTKHLHLLLSPLAVFLKRPGFSAIPPLTNDDDLGLVTGKDLTQILSLQTYSCVECGRCTEHCPASNTGKVLNPKELILGIRSYLNEFGPASDVPLLTESRVASSDNPPGRYLSMEAAFQCTTCGACEFQCPVGIQHLPAIVGLRRGATNTGAWEDRHGTKLFLALEKNGNALGLPAVERDRFIAKEALPLFDGSQEYCLWLGCMGSYDPKGREIIASFAQVMRHLGTSFGVLKKERCTGDPARRLGNDLVFGSLAESGLKTFATANVKHIVSICPHCVRTIAQDWREFGVAPTIEHHSEFMARHQDQLPREPGSETIVYHDPCYLGRYQEIYDEPRAVVEQAGTLVEAPRARERSFCCGAGGGLAFLGEESGSRVSSVRAAELTATGADTIGTACPFCNTMFRDALAAQSTQPQLLDIAQLTARRLPAPAPPQTPPG